LLNPLTPEFEIAQEPLAAGPIDGQFRARQIEPHTKPRTNPAIHFFDFFEDTLIAEEALHGDILWIVDVILLDAMIFIEDKLASHRSSSITRRKDLKDDLRGDAPLFPLAVGTAFAFRTAEGDENIGGLADGVVALDGIPKQVGCHEHKLLV